MRDDTCFQMNWVDEAFNVSRGFLPFELALRMRRLSLFSHFEHPPFHDINTVINIEVAGLYEYSILIYLLEGTKYVFLAIYYCE